MAGIHRLTAAHLKKTKPGRHADGGGLYLQIADGSKGATRSWLFRYMIDGRAREMGLGACNDFTLEEARERARKARQQKSDGIDPLEARAAERDAEREERAEQIPFKEAARLYIDAHETTWTNEKHKKQWPTTLERFVYPKLGNRPVSAVTPALVNDALAKASQRTPETAARVRNRVQRVLKWIADGKPLPVPSKTKRTKRQPSLPWSEIPKFVGELRKKKALAGAALEFLILTGARTGAVIGMPWNEVDLDKSIWTINSARPGTKLTSDLKVPLSARAIEILQNTPRENGNEFVFIGQKKGAGIGESGLRVLLQGMRSNISVHGFRSSFRTWAAEETDHQDFVCEASLGHVIPNKIERAYQRGELFKKRKRLMADWSGYCDGPQGKSGDVVPLRQRLAQR